MVKVNEPVLDQREGHDDGRLVLSHQVVQRLYGRREPHRQSSAASAVGFSALRLIISRLAAGRPTSTAERPEEQCKCEEIKDAKFERHSFDSSYLVGLCGIGSRRV